MIKRKETNLFAYLMNILSQNFCRWTMPFKGTIELLHTVVVPRFLADAIPACQEYIFSSFL